ncbi:disease resistance protein L6-like [Cryptomeria japonica]|uniref:disease resistance protein L6-like n=1 Tax=Cryptomeria japonica TaxID=3369 RepID=UPI0027D9FB92|nr:disease resistance protein L6-like [Cryptomeria japonica]
MQLKNIVNMVSKELGKVPFLVADKPIGLVDIVRDFEEAVESEHNAQIVGIVGMGGAVKTTLAKELYNRKSPSFKYSSFVFAVRDAASKNALHEKQNMLLKDLGVQDSAFDNIEGVKAILVNRLRSVPALIVLDDVDHGSQLDALLPTKDGLASGSLVIVTSRELNLLAKSGSTIYRIKALNPLHAKELFCWHAFLQSHSQEGFENTVEKFLQACDGLLLSLEVFGGLVYGKSKDYWESQLNKILKILAEDVKGRLNVSYNSLDEEEKEMFMDVACFFIGKKKSWVIEVWNESGWSGLHGWETLVNKCLVNVDKNDIIIMHDHLRDLGREFTGRHPPSRVWHQEQIIDIQKQIKLSFIKRNSCHLLL